MRKVFLTILGMGTTAHPALVVLFVPVIVTCRAVVMMRPVVDVVCRWRCHLLLMQSVS